jgi:predicted RNA-binding protein
MRRIVASFLRIIALCAGGYRMKMEAGEAMFEVRRNCLPADHEDCQPPSLEENRSFQTEV